MSLQRPNLTILLTVVNQEELGSNTTVNTPGMADLAYKLGQIGLKMGQMWDFFI